MATSAERQAAQRRLAREIKTGTYKPSGIGAKARRIATELETRKLIEVAHGLKTQLWHISGRQTRSSIKHLSHDLMGNPRGIKSLREVIKALERAIANHLERWDDIIQGMDDDDVSALFYH